MENAETSSKSTKLGSAPYAVVESGGKQFTVSVGDKIWVPEVKAEANDILKIEKVLLTSTADGSNVNIGSPLLNVEVTATVVKHFRGDKVIVYKKKKRKGYTKKQGHRANLTELKIETISA